MAVLANIWLSFLAGLFAPLGAVCVLPLYPGYLAYLANQLQEKTGKKKSVVSFSLFVAAGILLSLFVIGLVFSKILSLSLTTVTEVISPIAFVFLSLFSLVLIGDVNLSRYLPLMKNPRVKNPYLNSFLFGTFFAFIVLPCNPASLVILFALSTSVTSFLQNLFAFVAFGVGMAAPLILLSLISAAKSTKMISFITSYKTSINRVAGLLMLIISLYYLVFVFKLFG